MRRAARTDNNQKDIVSALRKIPGVTIELDHDDFLLGFKGKTYWIEIKNPDTVSKKTGKILESKKKKSQKKLEKKWTGHYAICVYLDDVLREIGLLS